VANGGRGWAAMQARDRCASGQAGTKRWALAGNTRAATAERRIGLLGAAPAGFVAARRTRTGDQHGGDGLGRNPLTGGWR
jgi:hypothetical protein